MWAGEKMKKMMKKSILSMVLVFTLLCGSCYVRASEQQTQDVTEKGEEVSAVTEETAEIPMSEPEEETEAQIEEKEVPGEAYTLKLNGICLLDKGNRLDVGVAYETNDPNVQFRWLQYDLAAQNWTEVYGWQKSNWITWYPPKAGDYWIYVEAKTTDGTVMSAVYGYHYAGTYVNLSGICVLDRSDHYDMGVAYQSNDPDISFRWLYYDLSIKKWLQVSDWYAGNWASWKAPHSGDFILYVEAKLTDGRVFTANYGQRVTGASITSFDVNPQSPGWVDSHIKLQGKYKDQIGEVGSVRYLVYNGKAWNEIAQTSESEAVWSPGALGSYLLCFEIYNKEGGLIEQSFRGYSIETPYVELGNISVNKTGDLSHVLSVSLQTNDSAAQYKWMYYNISTGQWYTISDWSGQRYATWNAPDVGNYWVHVEVRLHDGTTKSATIGYTVQRYSADLSAMMLRANSYSSSTPYIILVNRSTCKVGVFQGWQGCWTPVMYWDCAVGKPSTPTVSGVFRVGSRGYYFDSYGSRCFWYTQFYGDYLFHSVLYYPNGSLMDGRVGMALSHGCVRLQINNAKWIYDNIPSGTTVVVY